MSEKIKKLRNQEMTEGIVGAGNRTLLYALGVGKEEVEKPFIGIVNSWNEMHPGHKNLRELAAAVKAGVISEEVVDQRVDELLSLLVEHRVSPTALADVVADWL